MVDKKSLLNEKEFLKSFKDGLELQSFFRKLQARAVLQMLERERTSTRAMKSMSVVVRAILGTDIRVRRFVVFREI